MSLDRDYKRAVRERMYLLIDHIGAGELVDGRVDPPSEICQNHGCCGGGSRELDAMLAIPVRLAQSSRIQPKIGQIVQWFPKYSPGPFSSANFVVLLCREVGNESWNFGCGLSDECGNISLRLLEVECVVYFNCNNAKIIYKSIFGWDKIFKHQL